MHLCCGRPKHRRKAAKKALEENCKSLSNDRLSGIPSDVLKNLNTVSERQLSSLKNNAVDIEQPLFTSHVEKEQQISLSRLEGDVTSLIDSTPSTACEVIDSLNCDYDNPVTSNEIISNQHQSGGLNLDATENATSLEENRNKAVLDLDAVIAMMHTMAGSVEPSDAEIHSDSSTSGRKHDTDVLYGASVTHGEWRRDEPRNDLSSPLIQTLTVMTTINSNDWLFDEHSSRELTEVQNPGKGAPENYMAVNVGLTAIRDKINEEYSPLNDFNSNMSNSTREKFVIDSTNVERIIKPSINSPKQFIAGDQFKIIRLAVLESTSKLLDFVGNTWSKQETLCSKLFNINLLCLQLKNDLQQLENFGLHLVPNLIHVERKSMGKKLFSHVRLLQNIRNGIDRYLESLELETPIQQTEPECFASDENLKIKVGNIILLTKVIPGLIRAFGSFVDELLKLQINIICEEKVNITKQKKYAAETTEPPDEVQNTVQKAASGIDNQTNGTKQVPPALPPKKYQSADETLVQVTLSNIQVPKSVQGTFQNNISAPYSFMNEKITSNEPKDKSNSRERPMYEVPSVFPEQASMSTKSISHGWIQYGTEVASDGVSNSINQLDVMPRKKHMNQFVENNSEVVHQTAQNRFSVSELNTPEIRMSGVSMMVQRKLEELQQQAISQNVMLHTDNDCSFMDYDFPASIMEENLKNLCESDCKFLLFYSDEMFKHWKVLDNAASAFFQCMDNSDSPNVFILHSKFVVVAGHKMVYIGDVLARNLIDTDAKQSLIAFSNDLCDRLKHAVRTTKEAALSFPAVIPLQLMVDAIKEVTDSGYELREIVFRLAYVGNAEQFFDW